MNRTNASFIRALPLVFLASTFPAGAVRVPSDLTPVSWGNTALPPNIGDWRAFTEFGSSVLMVDTNGMVQAWSTWALNTPPEGLTGIMDVALGGFFGMALRDTGQVVYWGDTNNVEQWCFLFRPPPLVVGDVTAIAAGNAHALLLTAAGRVYAWGCDDLDQATVPPGLTDVVKITAGADHSVALRRDGTVVAWGPDWRWVCPSSWTRRPVSRRPSTRALPSPGRR